MTALALVCAFVRAIELYVCQDFERVSSCECAPTHQRLRVRLPVSSLACCFGRLCVRVLVFVMSCMLACLRAAYLFAWLRVASPKCCCAVALLEISLAPVRWGHAPRLSVSASVACWRLRQVRLLFYDAVGLTAVVMQSHRLACGQPAASTCHLCVLILLGTDCDGVTLRVMVSECDGATPCVNVHCVWPNL